MKKPSLGSRKPRKASKWASGRRNWRPPELGTDAKLSEQRLVRSVFGNLVKCIWEGKFHDVQLHRDVTPLTGNSSVQPSKLCYAKASQFMAQLHRLHVTGPQRKAQRSLRHHRAYAGGGLMLRLRLRSARQLHVSSSSNHT